MSPQLLRTVEKKKNERRNYSPETRNANVLLQIGGHEAGGPGDRHGHLRTSEDVLCPLDVLCTE